MIHHANRFCLAFMGDVCLQGRDFFCACEPVHLPRYVTLTLSLLSFHVCLPVC